ncbi:MAG: BREX-1 system adenine-specific DNA-methyltransferase PglX [Patescibacteria group bacterium]|nr:BREX-1 system adenine-specific DNA-methyltransferase PglX [Patescibacteria group bacterium]
MKQLNYQVLFKTLEGEFEKLNDNEYIISEDESTGQNYKLRLCFTNSLKETVNLTRNKIFTDSEETEKSILLFGIIFDDSNVVFIRQRPFTLKIDVQILKKSLSKISPVFMKKFRKLVKNFGDFDLWHKLFDRSDIIEEFYQLYRKAKKDLISNIRGISSDDEKEEFGEDLLMQLLITWYLQEKGFLDNNPNYCIDLFKNYKTLGYHSFYSCLKDLFEIMMGESTNGLYHESAEFGKVVVTGPAPFINGEFEEINISDNIFYMEDLVEDLKIIEPKKITRVPILNLFESRDWTEGNIDEFVLGAIYEKIMSLNLRKETGSFYTPEVVTSYICERIIFENIKENLFPSRDGDIRAIIANGSQEDILKIFKFLKKFKILDPAVGSAHFLESAMEVLLRLYENIIEKAKKLGYAKGLFIIASNDKGLTEINLMEDYKKEQLRLYLKFFIILSRNIYGVDINPRALKVARARLFMSLAKHFNSNNETFIRFPNVHFNLRQGNSLIGTLQILTGEEDIQSTLFDFLDDDKTEEILTSIKLVSELKSHLFETAKILKLKGDIIQEVLNLNEILRKKKIDNLDFKKILITKQKLIRILIVSLNSNNLLPLNALINEITDLFKVKIDNIFAEKSKVSTEKIRNVNPFHWILEFPEVFLEQKGFDIVVGNPPYGQNSIKKNEREILQKTWNPVSMDKKSVGGSYNTSAIFIERSYYLLKEKGYLGLIVNNSIARVDEFSLIRQFLLDKTILFELIDDAKIFKESGVTLEMISIFFKKEEKIQYPITIKSRRFKDFKPNEISNLIFKKYNRFLLYCDDLFFLIYNKARINVLHGKRGKDAPRMEKSEEFSIPYFFSGKTVKKYRPDINFINYTTPNLLDSDSWRVEFDSTLLITTKINDRYRVYVKPNSTLVGNNVIKLYFEDDFRIDEYALMAILNSDLMDYIVKRYIINYSELTVAFYDSITLFTPLKALNIKQEKVFNFLAKYMIVLKADGESVMSVFLTRIINALVFELYLPDFLIKDGVQNNLFENTEPLLNKIAFDTWLNSFWKAISDGISQNNPNSETISTIERTYEDLLKLDDIIRTIESISENELIEFETID